MGDERGLSRKGFQKRFNQFFILIANIIIIILQMQTNLSYYVNIMKILFFYILCTKETFKISIKDFSIIDIVLRSIRQ